MSLWLVILALALIKLPLLALLLWLAFRSEPQTTTPVVSDDGDDDGGSPADHQHPRGPRPHVPLTNAWSSRARGACDASRLAERRERFGTPRVGGTPAAQRLRLR
jgi:hypothetical protein